MLRKTCWWILGAMFALDLAFFIADGGACDLGEFLGRMKKKGASS